jgi:hypothetical protein
MKRGLRIALIAIACLLVAGAAAGLYAVASRPPEPMDARELGRITRQLASLARETAVLSGAILEDRVTGAYARTHREKIEEELGDQAAMLQAPLAPAVRAAGEKARTLAGALSAQVVALKLHYTEREELEPIRRELTRIAGDLDQLEARK